MTQYVAGLTPDRRRGVRGWGQKVRHWVLRIIALIPMAVFLVTSGTGLLTFANKHSKWEKPNPPQESYQEVAHVKKPHHKGDTP